MRGFEVLLSKATVSRYVRNDMIGSATRHNAALIVLDRLDQEPDGNVAKLTNKELEVLLR